MQITYSASITFFIVTAVGTALAGYPRLAFILFMSAAISLGARSLTRRCRGRVDLPGSSPEQMQQSLRDKVLPLADDLMILPGHGSASSIGEERATNPFLQNLT